MSTSAEDRTWFESEVVALLPDLNAAARRLTRNQADAEDLVAEAVAKAWGALPGLRDRAAFRGWIFRILTNVFISERRASAACGPHESFDEAAEPDRAFSLFERLHQPFLLWWSNPERQFLDRLLREDLERAVDGLPDVFRVVVTLADLHDLSYKEVADALDIPIGTVRSRLARGRSLLQKALWEHGRDAGLLPQSAATEASVP